MEGTMDKVDKLIDRVLRYKLSLPKYQECRNGRFSIVSTKIEPQQPITVVSWRQAIFEMGMGKARAVTLKLDIPDITYHLKDDEYGTWMSNSFQELSQADVSIRAAKGKVLIGGLGLGVIAQLIAEKSNVSEITVVEKEKDLIDLIKPFLNPRINIIHADLFDYVKEIKRQQYNFAFLDIWQSTGEWSWQTMVVPLRRAIGTKITKVLCWQEETMTGQVASMLWRMADLDVKPGYVSTQHYWVFREGVKYLRPVARIKPYDVTTSQEEFTKVLEIEEENKKDPMIQVMATLYLNHVGQPLWEKKFGKLWDETLPWFKKEYENEQAAT
jgi:hypothetical protein